MEELAKTATVTPGGFPVSPQKGSSSKAAVAAPAGDPDSSRSSSISDLMSNHGDGAGEAGKTPAPVPEALPRIASRYLRQRSSLVKRKTSNMRHMTDGIIQNSVNYNYIG